MREAQKIERFRSTQPLASAAGFRQPTELNESGLVGMQIQFEALEPRLHCAQEALRVLLVLKTHHEIIGVPHDDRVAFGVVVAPLLLEPQVEDVVKVAVSQNRRNDSLNAKGNFSFERRVEGLRDRPLVDYRHKR